MCSSAFLFMHTFCSVPENQTQLWLPYLLTKKFLCKTVTNNINALLKFMKALLKIATNFHFQDENNTGLELTHVNNFIKYRLHCSSYRTEVDFRPIKFQTWKASKLRTIEMYQQYMTQAIVKCKQCKVYSDVNRWVSHYFLHLIYMYFPLLSICAC